MFFENINFVVVIISAIVAVGLGFLWYSPIMFFKHRGKKIDYTPKSITIFAMFTLVTSYIVAALVNSLIITSFGGLVLFAILLWLAFSMPIALNSILFGDDSMVLFSINSGYYLVAIILVTIIIGIFG
jgi:hypothetical protein